MARAKEVALEQPGVRGAARQFRGAKKLALQSVYDQQNSWRNRPATNQNHLNNACAVSLVEIARRHHSLLWASKPLRSNSGGELIS
jgi:hypothetical protein